MAEVKNAFIKSKMNKDLDDRLIPSGEYRDAQNVQISRSEGSDVGALENVLGNKEILFSSAQSSFSTLVGAPNIKCIGQFVDENNTTIYSFWTDNFDIQASNRIIYNSAAKNYILAYSTNGSDNYKVLVEGAFLNFSQTNPIIGVNVIEGLLFWTDDRNQPRKINVNLANPSSNPSNTYTVPTYYTVEDSISVSKYNPYEPIQVLNVSSLAAAEVATADVNGAVDNSKTIVVDGITGTIALGLGVSGTDVKSGTIVNKINSATSFNTNKANTIANDTILKLRGLETTMYDVSSAKLPDGTTDNPYEQEDYGGDPQFLEDKFIRFSYRFRFDDGEYSIFAPFTQPMFIPKQDGYFQGDDEKLAYESTIVEFMENKVTKIDLLIPLPSTRLALQTINTSAFKILEIDILYKESDGQAIRVVDTIKVENQAPWSDKPTDDVFIYSYESTKPYKTLPTADLIRVYDRVPVRAKAQELVSNRIVYGNFQDKHTPPAALNYQVGVSDKSADNVATGSQTRTEYPNHTVKQNRNYQVGIVLSDKFGRQSSTILSNNLTQQLVNGFGADTVYSPYRCDPTAAGCGDSTAPTWPGDSLKVLFNETISSNSPAVANRSLGTPGIYNGDTANAAYNPLGWFSYKIVVKQQEQEYYNVYLPGVMKGNPDGTETGGQLSNIVLINDNINKVPRDLTEVGPQQQQFRSSVQLFGRVQNDTVATSVTGNEQIFPGRLSDTVSTISVVRQLFDVAIPIVPAVPIFGFYNAKSNPLIGQVITSQAFGMVNTIASGSYPVLENLAVVETEPDISRLDIYWETSTAGLVSELNTAVATDTGGAQATSGFILALNEGMVTDTAVAGPFFGVDIIGQQLRNARIKTAYVHNEWSVTNGAGTDVTEKFVLIETGDGKVGSEFEYTLKTVGTFYYGLNAATTGNFSFSFTYRLWNTAPTPPAYFDNAFTTPPVMSGLLGNEPPTITGTCPRSILITTDDLPTIATLVGKNGSADTSRDTDDLTWTITSQSQNGSAVSIFTMTTTNNQGVITASTGAAAYVVVARVTDAGGKTADCILNITIGQPEVPSRFVTTTPMQPLFDGDGVRYSFTSNYTNLDQVTNAISQTYAWITSSTNPLVSPATENSTDYAAFKCPSGSIANYIFKREKLAGGLGSGEGAFYVQFFANCAATDAFTTSQSFTHVSAVVEYRATSSDNWSVAFDVDGTLTNSKAQYQVFSGVPIGEGGFNNIGGIDNNMTLSGSTVQTSGVRRVFAFDIAGEYRITMGALDGQMCNFPACSLTKKLNVNQGFTLGDYSYAGGVSTPQQYQYNVGGATYYAKEHITKYVSQLYTDLALTTKVNFGANVSKIFFRPNVNWEYTKNGSYSANFNATGARTNSSSLVNY